MLQCSCRLCKQRPQLQRKPRRGRGRKRAEEFRSQIGRKRNIYIYVCVCVCVYGTRWQDICTGRVYALARVGDERIGERKRELDKKNANLA